MRRTYYLASALSFGRRLGVERLELRMPPSDTLYGLLFSAAWFQWGEELFAAGISIDDFEAAFAQVKSDAQAKDPSLIWLDEVSLWTVAQDENIIFYDPLEVDFDDWLVEHVSRLETDLDLEAQAAVDQLKLLLNQAVDLAIANGGSLAGVQPEGNLEGDFVVSTDDTTTSTTCMTCSGTNQVPVAVDDSFTILHDTELRAHVGGNDTLPMDGPQPNTFWQVTGTGYGPFYGTVDLDMDGWFFYQPQALYKGFDEFTYKIYDGAAWSNEATVTIEMTNKAPVANPDPGGAEPFYRAGWNSTMVVDDVRSEGLMNNDTDADTGDTEKLTATLVTQASNGVVSPIGPNGGFTYTPNIGFTGMDSFTYKVSDGIDDSAPAIVSIEVIGINLEIHDGQGGAVLPEEPAPKNETTRGAYTVYNANDTDGDGRIDYADTEVAAYKTTFGAAPLGALTVTVANSDGFLEEDRVRIAIPDIHGNYMMGWEEHHIAAIVGNDVTFHEPLEEPYPGGADMLHPGRNEVDLMTIVLHEPTKLDPAVTDVWLSWVGVSLWETSVKKIPVTDLVAPGLKHIPLSEFVGGSLTYWAEATTWSGIRDISITLTYPIPLTNGTGVTDNVLATGIHAVTSAVAVQTVDAATFFGTGPGMTPTSWDIMPHPVRTWIDNIMGGVGLRPRLNDPYGIHNVIIFEYRIFPSRDPAVYGTWESDGVMFDATRQIEAKLWSKLSPAAIWNLDYEQQFNLYVEDPNDDTDDTDESDLPVLPPVPSPPPPPNEVDNAFRFYAADGPGTVPGSTTLYASVGRFNGIDWLRVKFDGARPTGYSGSRVSAEVPWHSSYDVVNVNNFWERRQGGENVIGEGHMPLGDQP